MKELDWEHKQYNFNIAEMYLFLQMNAKANVFKPKEKLVKLASMH